MRGAIGIDIGGTKTIVAAVDETGAVQAEAAFSTESTRGFASGLARLKETIHAVIRQAGWNAADLAGIGIGCAGPVDHRLGTIENPYTLPGWEGADIVKPLEHEFRLPVRLENDADAAALGEWQFGAGRGTLPVVMITLGTGIGGGVVVNGAIYRGLNEQHPELGHIPVAPGGPACYCGTTGCWEALASGTALSEAGKAAGFRSSRELFSAASSDPRAEAIVQRAIEATSRALWTILHTFLPARIILGGGIAEEHFERFAGPAREQLALATQSPKGGMEIVKAQLGRAAGAIGGACLILHNPESSSRTYE